ncbi:hypothetical protein FB45DRAFT_865190 [Roridomyces roridus]|uniref:Uncharacterized protein n=1 Tax=Roridomyces roridus TaxID=1738132 RepID=A0AAD7BYM1_9AGAR|nr:hypothetical protein FB45DRAFT_865190 [Roridomyces roridus]
MSLVVLATADPDGNCHLETKNLDGQTNLKASFYPSCCWYTHSAPFSFEKRSAQLECPRPRKKSLARASILIRTRQQNFYIYHGTLRYPTTLPSTRRVRIASDDIPNAQTATHILNCPTSTPNLHAGAAAWEHTPWKKLEVGAHKPSVTFTCAPDGGMEIWEISGARYPGLMQGWCSQGSFYCWVLGKNLTKLSDYFTGILSYSASSVNGGRPSWARI